MAAKVHLHRDLSTTFCGKDAAHIPMTYAVGDTTCKKCLSTLEKERQQLTAVRDEHAAAAEKVMGVFEPTTSRLNALNEEINALSRKHSSRVAELSDKITALQREHSEAIAARTAERDAAYQEHSELARQGAKAIAAKDEAAAALATLPSAAE